MTYNEWRDELKSNLLCVSEAERRRVLDYYAEAYADRRDAGFTEREIIAEFGAPYDAAQKILYENSDENARDNSFGSAPNYARGEKRNGRRQPSDDPFQSDADRSAYNNYGGNRNVPPRDEQYSPPPPPARKSDYTWVFVIICIVCAVPLFGIIMGLVGITIGFVAAPFGVLVSGVATIGAAIGQMFTDPLGGAASLGIGLMLFGISLVLIPLFIKLVKLMWTLFKKILSWIKSLFVGGGQKA